MLNMRIQVVLCNAALFQLEGSRKGSSVLNPRFFSPSISTSVYGSIAVLSWRTTTSLLPSLSGASSSSISPTLKVESIPTKPYEGQKTGTSGLRKKVKVYQQENYLGNWIQSLFNSFPVEDYKGGLLMLGGNEWYFNKEAAQIINKIAAGNGVGKILVGSKISLEGEEWTEILGKDGNNKK